MDEENKFKLYGFQLLEDKAYHRCLRALQGKREMSSLQSDDLELLASKKSPKYEESKSSLSGS